MTLPNELTLAGAAAAGVIAGLLLLARGLVGYRVAGRISGTATSRIASLAVGEVLISGTAEPMELTLVSPLQSASCVYYRSRITQSDDGEGRDLLRDERAVGFRVRDSSGWVRVFPGAAAFDVPDRYDESSRPWGGEPAGLVPRVGSAFAPGQSDREAQIAALLTVHEPGSGPVGSLASFGRGGTGSALGGGSGHRRFREARIDVGEVVTVTGRALPFRDLADPAAANLLDGSVVPLDDPEIALDLAEARAAGILEATPADAWGNAGIPGFGIGRPVRVPELDPAADQPPAADPGLATRVAATFEIPDDMLVLAATPDDPLQIALGGPEETAARHTSQFLVGLAGAVLAIGSAMSLALLLDGGLT
jgi:hypothetical protein